MSKSRKRYDDAFKREAVQLLATAGKKQTILEKELGLYQGALRHWREELEADPVNAFPGTGHLKPEDEAYRQLLRENAILREERDILKKAIAIFSAKPKTNTDS
jgi:transposase